MRRLPFLPTLIVALAIPAMIALGLWQLRRAEWKAGLLAELAANVAAPVVDAPDDLSGLAFRQVRVDCARLTLVSPTAARSADGRSGYRQTARCDRADAEPVLVSLGVASRPQPVPLPANRRFTGSLVPRDGVPAFLLVSEAPAPGLAAEALPSTDTIPDNHRAYAVQWFAFAAILAVIYGLYLRQRARK